MALSRRLFLLSPLALLGCRKRREVKIKEKSPRIPVQQQLDRFVAGVEREGIINTADLLGGKVLFASEFRKPKYRAGTTKDRLLADVQRTNIPSAYKSYNEKDQIDNPIYIVFPDSYIRHLNNEKSHFLVKAFLYFQFVLARDRSDRIMAKKIATFIFQKLKRQPPPYALKLCLHIGYALSQFRANFKLREFLLKNRDKAVKLPIWFLGRINLHLIVSRKAVDEHLSMLEKIYPAVLDPARDACMKYIRREFDNASSSTQNYVIQVFEDSQIPGI